MESLESSGESLEWSARRWMRILESHVKEGDIDAVERARPLMNMDERFGEKVNTYVRHLEWEDLRGYEEKIQIMARLGGHLLDVIGFMHAPLHRAVRLGHRRMLHALITAGADVNIR